MARWMLFGRKPRIWRVSNRIHRPNRIEVITINDIIMIRLTYLAAVLLIASFFVIGCKNVSGNADAASDSDSIAVEGAVFADTTIYGVCGEGTTMNTLELVLDSGDTLMFMIAEDADGRKNVQGGLLVGDKMAVISGGVVDGEAQALKVVNLTTLLGKWTSLDKNIEIQDGGVVKSNVQAETNPWTSWKILNGQLVLNRDTFDISSLGKDSLYLENKNGIFTYKRQI